MTVAVLLIDPKYPHNVGAALRACALLGASVLYWTGNDVPDPDKWPPGARLPREERMRCYKRTRLVHLSNDLQIANALTVAPWGQTGATIPVCVEIAPGAEDLRGFQHPHNAVYVFGREDGSVPKWVRSSCYRFLRIPNALPEHDPDGRTPFNLAAAVNITLYDRLAKPYLTGSPDCVTPQLQTERVTATG